MTGGKRRVKRKVKTVTYFTFSYYMLSFAKFIQWQSLFRLVHKNIMAYRYAQISRNYWQKEVLYLSMNGTVSSIKPMKA